jgi:hypothetical protein
MNNYRVTAKHFVAGLVASGGVITQAAPILAWAIGKDISFVVDYAQRRGWQIEPLVDDAADHPRWLEHHNKLYELRWSGDKLTRIALHEDGDIVDLTFDQLPDALKGLLL